MRRVYSEDADHLIKWLAQRVQRPDIKINHAIVLGGMQGVGKDSLLEPVKHAVGPWIVAANHAPENGDLADALDALGHKDGERIVRPPVVTIDKVLSVAGPELGDFLRDRKNRRQVPHRFEECEYVPVRNDAAADGLWKIRGKRCSVYANRSLSLRDQIAAARKLG